MPRLKAWAPAAIWMSVIFIMSAMPGDVSSDQSGLLLDLAMLFFRLLLGPQTAAKLSPDIIHLLIRKGAHMTEYAILFLCYHHALKFEGVRRPKLCALLLCACYAATDEWHQSFTEDRGPSPVDVLIDTIGATLGMGFEQLFNRFRKKDIK